MVRVQTTLGQHTTFTTLRILTGITTLPVYTVLHGMPTSPYHGVKSMAGLPFVDPRDLVVETLAASAWGYDHLLILEKNIKIYEFISLIYLSLFTDISTYNIVKQSWTRRFQLGSLIVFDLILWTLW